MVSGSFLLFLLSLISYTCAKQKFIATGRRTKQSHSSVVFCFLQNSFCIRFVVLPRICEMLSASPHNIIKSTGKVFLTGGLQSWKEQTVRSADNEILVAHFIFFDTKPVKRWS